MAQITLTYSGVPFTTTPDLNGNLALPALGQAGFDFSGVPAGSALAIASFRVAGTWSGPSRATQFVSVPPATLYLKYGGNAALGATEAYFYVTLPYNGVFPADLLYGPFDTLGTPQSNTGDPYFCPQQGVYLGIQNASAFTGLSFTISLLQVTFTIVPNACTTWGGGGGGGGGGGNSGGNSGGGSVPIVSSLFDPSLCQLQLTRPIFRDAIRSKLGLTPPIQYIQGAAQGEEPAGEKWPGNYNINQAIADAIRELNRRTGFHSTHALSVAVPIYTGVGPQWVRLQGIGAGPWQNLINDVQRAIWDDGNGNLTRLRTRSFFDMDRQGGTFDLLTPDTPREFGIHAYEMGLLPGTAAGGTLHLWAGTGLIGFCSDTDVIDELSLDEQAVIEDLAAKKLRLMKPNEENAVAQIELYGRDSDQGIKDIRRNLAHRSALEQSSLTVQTRRRRRFV